MVKKSSLNAFLANRRKYEARVQRLRTTQGDEDADSFSSEDVFELQHHHLLACLERTTVRYVL